MAAAEEAEAVTGVVVAVTGAEEAVTEEAIGAGAIGAGAIGAAIILAIAIGMEGTAIGMGGMAMEVMVIRTIVTIIPIITPIQMTIIPTTLPIILHMIPTITLTLMIIFLQALTTTLDFRKDPVPAYFLFRSKISEKEGGISCSACSTP
jgi:hypothetical protein